MSCPPNFGYNSLFGNKPPTFGYNSLTGNTYVPTPPVTPSAPLDSVQFNNNGNFGGDSNFIYDGVGTLFVPSIKPDTIKDGTNSVGTAGQFLTSTGSGLEFVNVPSATTPNKSILFNNSGVISGDPQFTFDELTNNVILNGRLAIGTTSNPAYALDIVGNNPEIQCRTTSDTSEFQLRNSTAPQFKRFRILLNGPANTTDLYSQQDGVLYRPFRFNPIASLGEARISIGTNDANASGIQLSNHVTNRKIILFQSTNNEHQYFGFGVNAATFRYQINGTSDSHVFFAATGTTTSNELFRVNGDSTVQIGINTNSRLTISKAALGSSAPNTVASAQYLKLGGTEFRTGSYRLIGFGYNTGTNNQPAYIGYFENNQAADTHGSLVFGTRPTTTNVVPTERMRISPNGNVSIGNTNSTFPLEVTGTVRSTASRPDTILDTSNSAGTAGQVLSSTGTSIQWTDPRGISYTGVVNTSLSRLEFDTMIVAAGGMMFETNFSATETTNLTNIISGRFFITTRLVGGVNTCEITTSFSSIPGIIQQQVRFRDSGGLYSINVPFASVSSYTISVQVTSWTSLWSTYEMYIKRIF
jgi:hypothetical protein